MKSITKVPHMLHGGDYNPDQWLKYPEILKQDIELMKKAGINAVSLGIFAWVALEPEEGVFTFEWMDEVVDRLYKNGINVILATPSGSKPAWLSQRYPEVNRVGPDLRRARHGWRHNHCQSSPVYREKVAIINKKIAERYGHHPAAILWHVSNEYQGECRCSYCEENFRSWLKERYGTLDNLNEAWWNHFHGHTYTDWSQVVPPSSLGEGGVNCMNLDFKRFTTYMTIDFYLHEVKAVKSVCPHIPCTTNFMGFKLDLDYQEFGKAVDLISYDHYPLWHEGDDACLSYHAAMSHDAMRSIGNNEPWLLMESTPSVVNWSAVSKLKRPKMHLLSCVQNVAHGADGVLYFQFRKSRGGFEKFHGAVVDHDCSDSHRVFREVAEVGDLLSRLDEVVGSKVESQVAVYYDWDNHWAIEESKGPRNSGAGYYSAVFSYYEQLVKRGISVDLVGRYHDLSGYKLVIAPMLYMLRRETADKIRDFVKNGGILVTTYMTGYVDECDLCYLGGMPGLIRDVLGVKVDEIDALYDRDRNSVEYLGGNVLGLEGSFECRELCELVTIEGAETIAVYGDDFYKGYPAVTVNSYGKGKAIHVATKVDSRFIGLLTERLIDMSGVSRIIDTDLPYGVYATARHTKEESFVFLMNFATEERQLVLDDRGYTDVLTGEKIGETITLEGYGFKILKRKK